MVDWRVVWFKKDDLQSRDFPIGVGMRQPVLGSCGC